MRLLTLVLLCALNAVGIAGFDGFFGNMFHQQPPPQHQQQKPRGHAPQMWQEQSDAVTCSDYLCPSTLVCVTNPKDCPCPHFQDVRCVMPDAQIKGAGTVFCVSGQGGCQVLDRFAKW